MGEEYTIQQLTDLITTLSDQLERRIGQSIDALDRRARFAERELLRLLLEDVLPKLETDLNGNILPSTTNYRVLSQFDTVFNEFRQTFIADALRPLASDYLAIIELTGTYYEALRFPERVVSRVARDNAAIEARIGIKAGKLIQGGYLDELARTADVKTRLKTFVLNAITGKAPLVDFTRGLREKVVGNPDVDGELVRYFRQYTYDTFNQVHEVKNRQFADALGLEWFIYAGSVIPTTRRFCRKRAGKVFNTREAQAWRNDPDLIGKNRPEPYDPLIDRGRWNCRHFIKYISAEMAAQLGRQDAIQNQNAA